jgi:small-conductance mechanosensitive channel
MTTAGRPWRRRRWRVSGCDEYILVSLGQLDGIAVQLTGVRWLPYPVPILGTIAVLVVAALMHFAGRAYVSRQNVPNPEKYRKRRFLDTVLVVIATLVMIVLWARVLPRTSTFLGLIGAGLAVALREPLLSIAGRLAIFAGHMFTVKDRVQINQLSGDIIDIGFFYTRMLEIGNWISGDQATGRIVQFPNAQIFGTPIFNYTQNFSYIWDEVTLPVTYDSNLEQISKILTDVGGEYSREFLQGAEQELEQMRRYFVVPTIELKPVVYVKVTSNWLELTMRYIVDPKKRRPASSFIYGEVFKRIQKRHDITIASETMDLTIQQREDKQRPAA